MPNWAFTITAQMACEALMEASGPSSGVVPSDIVAPPRRPYCRIVL
jgi:hypothetical protein